MGELDILLRALRAAGSAILSIQQDGFAIGKKSNNDIVTQADLAVNAILKNEIMLAYPGDGWLSEEEHDDRGRLAHKRVWIVDPVDGTREFAAGIPEYAISVALVEDGAPILAGVYNPATDELFHAIKDGGAWKGGSQLQCASLTVPADIMLLASRSEYARGEWEFFKKDYHVQQVGSIAYKLALVAAGKAHATFSLGPKNEWDIAAGVLLVTEAGGMATDKYRRKIQFNRNNVLVDGIVATIPDINDEIFAAIHNYR
jgi:myo-inositol-1(or 4)-monophosphatase